MEIDVQSSTEGKSDSLCPKEPSTRSASEGKAKNPDETVDCKVLSQNTERINDTVRKSTPAKSAAAVAITDFKTVNTPNQPKPVTTPNQPKPVTTTTVSLAAKRTSVTSKNCPTLLITSSEDMKLSGNTKALAGTKSPPSVLQSSSMQEKKTPLQTPTIVSSDKTKSESPVIKSVTSQSQVRIPGVLSGSVVSNATNGVAAVVNRSTVGNTSSARKDLPLFKLGMEKSYEQYVNQFSTNLLAKNKQHAQEERERRRGITTKFNLAEYNYHGSIVGDLEKILLTLRCSIVSLETSIPTAFMHPMWPVQRSTWVKAVHMSKTAAEFASVLSFFEGFVKPVVMRSVWRDAVGHLEFFRNLTESKVQPKKPVREEEEDIKHVELIGKSNCWWAFSDLR